MSGDNYKLHKFEETQESQYFMLFFFHEIMKSPFNKSPATLKNSDI